MDKIIEYIIRFLLGESYLPEVAKLIGYTSDSASYEQYKLIIKPSRFFNKDVYGSPDSLPCLPLQQIDGVPLLYGNTEVEMQHNRLIVGTDIIASSYFLLSRYEEFVKKDVRDVHGRFPGKASLPYKAGFINSPVVDKYGQLLKKWLQLLHINLPDEQPQIKKIYLTHDVDEPFFFRTNKNLINGLLFSNRKKNVIKSYFGKLENNWAYTFPWIIDQNNKLIEAQPKISCEQIFFLRAGGNHTHDKPSLNLLSKDMQALISLCTSNNATIGLHASYASGINPTKVLEEKKKLEKIIGTPIHYNRHHFLTCREPEDFEQLEQSGITDDFTMGYADVAGFRLGTCRPVFWINPANKKVSSLLTLHPLTVMECTLDRAEYMGLNFEEAYNYCIALIQQTKKHCGDVVLLWHNTTLIENAHNWQRKLYKLLLNNLEK